MRVSIFSQTAALSLLAGSLLVRGEETNTPAAPAGPFPVKIQVDAGKVKGPLHPIWRYFGADEPNYAYMKDGRKLIGELGQLGPTGSVFFRAHNLLTSGDGTPAFKWGSTGAYHEDPEGQAVYDWTIVDRIFETYLERGVRPYTEIGFMPKELSTHPDPYQHQWKPGLNYNLVYTGWSYPPKDYDKWSELVYQWAKHCVEKYGQAEVEKWYWEVWNEANIGYWKGTPAQFYHLHDCAVEAVRRALPTAKVGGMDSSGGGSALSSFLEHCLHGTNNVTGKIGTPIDFISFHAKGSPGFTNGHVRMGIANQLGTINDSFRRIARFPELRDKPIVIGESDPDGCAACTGEQLGYRNGLLYASYTAACFAHEPDIADQNGVNLEGALTWAFEFEDQPIFAGFRAMASSGIDLPVLNVFRMFSQMSGQRIATESDGAVPLDTLMRRGVRAAPDVAAFATLDARRLCVMVWHYHDDDVPGPDASVSLELDALPLASGPATLRHYRIDENHSDSFAAWQRLGKPAQPIPEQYAQLESAGQLAALGAPETITVNQNKAAVPFLLPRQAISLLVLEW
jgi:xylan 1,4-beta-xylosidase